MEPGNGIVQIYTGESTTLAASLAAVVSTVKGCIARVNSMWPRVDQADAWGDAFLVISNVESTDASEFENQLRLLGQSKRTRRFPEFIFVSNNLKPEQQKRLWEAHATEVFESSTDLRRLRYLIESLKIEYAHWIKRLRLGINSGRENESWLQRKIKKIADVDTNVLLSGETGVGKTLIAEKIHRSSKRAKHPFVVVDCASIPENLVESELFGHAKGAFTDACSKKIGQFEHVGDGTILLDEIDSLAPTIQAKLLRVVENREFRRIGENNPIAMKARIISTTNLNLDEMVERKQFRADLFFRLNAYEIKIPNLSHRKQEIEPLSHFFAEEFASENRQIRKTFSDEVMDLFKAYDWPGNLRELRNCVFHGAIDSDDSVIRLENLPEKLIRFSETLSDEIGYSVVPNAAKSQEDNELFDTAFFREARRLVLALDHNNYNRSQAAKDLGVSRMTIYNMMKRYHLS